MEQQAPRQTQSFLRELLEKHGLSPKNKLGQNFLIDLNLLDLVARRAELTSKDVVLEVGTGTGGLTGRMAAEAGAVCSIEIDPAFHALAKEHLAWRRNVVLVLADVLQNKNHLNPHVLEKLRETKQQFGCETIKLVANLPYAVATPVISNLLLSEVEIERMVVTVQWEIAERLMANPGTKDYSALSVLVQSVADVELVRKLAPSVFWPRPQVESAIVFIHPNPAKRSRVSDIQSWRVFLRDLYSHRRKNLRGALAGWPSGRKDKDFIDSELARLGLDGTQRAETLDVDQHLRLFEAFG